MRLPFSVTRRLDYFSKFSLLYQWKLAQWHTKFAIIGAIFSQIVKNSQKLSKTLKILLKWRNFAKSGHTAPISFQYLICSQWIKVDWKWPMSVRQATADCVWGIGMGLQVFGSKTDLTVLIIIRVQHKFYDTGFKPVLNL